MQGETLDPKTRMMMAEVQELMGVADVYKPGVEQASMEATRPEEERQTQIETEQVAE